MSVTYVTFLKIIFYLLFCLPKSCLCNFIDKSCLTLFDYSDLIYHYFFGFLEEEIRNLGYQDFLRNISMAEMHSFDIVCKVEMHEVNNAVDQAKKQLAVRYDFKGSKSSITLNSDNSITLIADDEYKMQSLSDILKEKLEKRGIPLKSLNFGKAESALGGAIRQVVTFQSGIPMEKAKELVKFIKGLKLKMQAQIQEDKVRVQGQKIDDLQAIMKAIKDQNYEFAMQFVNYK
jgi:cyclic-di-GMP-binding protein